MLRPLACLLLSLVVAGATLSAPRRPVRPQAPVMSEAVFDAAVDAATGGDAARLRRLLAKAPANGRDSRGRTALFYAVNSNQPDLVRSLLARGASPNHISPDGATALSVVQYRDETGVAILRQLLAARAKPDLRKPGGYTALMLAADAEAVEAVQLLLKAGADPNAKNGDGETPLHSAAGLGTVPVVRALVARGARVNDASNDGGTPLSRAAASGNAEAFHLLLSSGANPKARGKDGSSLLHSAAIGADATIMRTLLKLGLSVNERNREGHTPLMKALALNATEMAKALLDAGADPNAADAQGKTPLMLAASEGDEESVKLLLARGADVHRKAKDGSTAMSAAKGAEAPRRSAAVVEMLTKAGAVAPVVDLVTAVKNHDLDAVRGALARGENPNQRVESEKGPPQALVDAIKNPGREGDAEAPGAKPLDLEKLTKVPLALIAVPELGETTEVLEALLKAGADANAADEGGTTLLMRAAGTGKRESLELLLRHGARVDNADLLGFTPLHYAVNSTSAEAVQLVLDKGADVRARTGTGQSVLHLAIGAAGPLASVDGHLVLLLVAGGADVNAADEEGIAPLMLAAMLSPPDPDEIAAAGKGKAGAQDKGAASPAVRKAVEKLAERLPKGALDRLGTAVMAPAWNKVQLVNFLIASGADPRLRSKNGMDAVATAVLASVEHDRSEAAVLRALMAAGGDINSKSGESPTPLALAAAKGHTPTINTLLALGASPNVKMHRGLTALHVAVLQGETAAARLLLQKGAAVDARGDQNLTPLHLAVRDENVELVKLLLQRGAKPTTVGPDGATPLKLARENGNREIERLLKKAGAK